MKNNQPLNPDRPAVPELPPGHPLAAKMAAWTQLRDELAGLAAHLEYLSLMMRLQNRKG